VLETLQVGWLQASAFRNSREHRESDLFIIVEREDEIRPSLASEGPV
jgi:hypothetical protein